jgi:type I restriction enzyme S subunit
VSEVPEGWIKVSIAEINDYSGTSVDPSRYPDLSYELYSVPSFPTKKPELVAGKEVGSTKQRVVPNDILLCKINPRINRVWRVAATQRAEQIASSEWIVVRQPLIDARFLQHQFAAASFRERLCAEVSGVGGSLTRAQPKKVASYEVVLAPAAEQERIAHKLDELLAQVDTLKARIDAIPVLLKRFRQSVLASAVSGRLSEDWRTHERKNASDGKQLHALLRHNHELAGGHARGNASDPSDEAHDLSAADIPLQWDIATMRDVCEPGRPITYGILKPGPELEEGVPYIRVADFPGNKLQMDGIRKTSKEIDLLFKRARLRTGDLLLSIRGSVGRLIKIPKELDGANITQDTARLSISPAMCTDYVYWALLAESTQRRMRAATRGVAVRGINIGDVRALQIPLPSKEEQTEIVHRIEQLFAFADQLEAKVATAKQRIHTLTQSILAKAFRGELVPQDPNDEPASVLLERIRAQRAATPKTRRGRKPVSST